MTKARPENCPTHGQKDLFSNLVDCGPAADKFDASVELGLLPRLVVAGFHALTTRKTRQALKGLERVRLRDIGLDPDDIDRAVQETADQASEEFARRLHGRWHSADHVAGSLNAEINCLACAGRRQ
ncbi:hypothetical protein RUE5091_04087 [Ruegeria denitrificans]|uniref:DUF1127 domain-containing protein n=1 Tax=Ruegeria denitrificans TaxID=1715692 RepID=A0A0N7MAW3_9RHOB|nr:hypothetical protein [Ruegeria denitrificans]CUK17132.1 hypothetical protein RUE5091_04087 [Ruegeria denitrificans]